MIEYTFTFKYRLSDDDRNSDALVERLGGAGCTHALVGVGIADRLALEFTREAESAQIAVQNALETVQNAIPSAMLIEVFPDFGGLTEVAEIVGGVSPQKLRKLMLANNDFPLPVRGGNPSVWHLADVLGWLGGRKGYEPDQTLRVTATAALQVNVAKEARWYAPENTHELEHLIA